MKACGGACSPETRRKYYISGPQWAAAYQGQARRRGRARNADAVIAANKELLTLHELIAHRLVQILLGLHRGRVYSV